MQAIRRVEAVSGIKHRPASSYEDTLTLGAGDARTAALWRVHRQRLAALLQKLRVGHPSPRTDRYDPFALRALLLLGVFVLADRGRRQRLRPAALGVPLRRARQGRGSAHRCLGDAAGLHRQAAHHAGRRRHQPGRGRRRSRPQPSRSPTAASWSCAATGAAHRRLVAGGAGQRWRASERIEAPAAGQCRGRVRAQARGAQVGHGDRSTPAAFSCCSWPFQVIPDHPPKIALTKDPERSPRGGAQAVLQGRGRLRRRLRRDPHPPRRGRRRTRPRPPGRGPAPRRARAPP